MPFSRLGLFYRQDFVGGYRYLDHCGDFMVTVEKELGLMPSGDTTPTGGKMENPEIGIRIELNSSVLRVIQDLPDQDINTFIGFVERMSELYQTKFDPIGTERIGVASNMYRIFERVDHAEDASLKWGGDFHKDLAARIGLPPKSRNVEYNFSSGSKNLRTKIYPATIEKQNVSKRNFGSRVTRYQQEQVRRHNAGAERASQIPLAHALFVDLDLTEDGPPEGAFKPLLNDLLAMEKTIIPLLD